MRNGTGTPPPDLPDWAVEMWVQMAQDPYGRLRLPILETQALQIEKQKANGWRWVAPDGAR